jgi:probable HAF family extracellular repeat protein
MSVKLYTCLRAWLVLLLCAFASAAQARPNEWAVVELGVLPGAEFSSGWGLNNRGDVVGHSTFRFRTSSTFWSHPFVWQNGAMTDLMPPGYPMMESGVAQAVGNDGAVVFQVSGQLYTWRDGVTTKLPFWGVARDINNHGDIVGSHAPTGFHSTAFLYRNGVLHDLGTVGGGRHSEAYGVNNGGMVVGASQTLPTFFDHAFVYENGTMRDIGTLGGDWSAAFDVNDRGTVVGTAADAAGRGFAFVWDAAGGMRKVVDDPGGAVAINNRGDIVGNLGFPGSFLYSNGVVTRLDQLPALRAAGFTGFLPEDMNERGWIVGTAFGPNRAAAVVLIPKGS